eukprot:Skav203777  [mRNA]  locus=scaffold206:291037:292950:+ [translate_table: standard]
MGPASALAWYLAKLAWSINKHGDLETSTYADHLHLLDSNVEDIRKHLHLSWAQKVSESAADRQGCRNLPLIHQKQTVKAFETLPVEDQTAVGIEVAMGFMTSHQKQHFTEVDSDVCPLCPAVDTCSHQLLDCPATESARVSHQEMRTFLLEADPIHCELPVVFRDPQTSFHDQVWAHYPQLELHRPAHITPDYLYTDAACLFPDDPDHRWVSIFIVMQISLDQDIDPARPPAQLLRDHYAVIGAGHVTGTQTVPRGELQAAVQAQEMCLEVPIITDSAYVITCHQLVASTMDIQALHKKPNWDLLSRLHQLHWHQGIRIPVQKIKSHQDLLVSDPLERKLRLGNAMADEAAKQANRHHATCITQPLRSLADSQQEDQRRLREQYQMRAKIGSLTARLLQPEVVPSAPGDRLALLLNWQIEDPVTYPLQVNQPVLALSSRWGPVYSSLLLHWLQSLKWPSQPDRNEPPVGISWIELLVNFMAVTGRTVPISVSGQFLCQEEDAMMDIHAHGISQAAKSFRSSIDHLQTLAGHALLPPHTCCMVKSIYLLDSGLFRQGIRFRPEMPQQQATLRLLHEYCQEHKTEGRTVFFQFPKYPAELVQFSPLLARPSADTPKDRQQRYTQRRAELTRLARQQRGE